MGFHKHRTSSSSKASFPGNVDNMDNSKYFKAVESDECDWFKVRHAVGGATIGLQSSLGTWTRVSVIQYGVEQEITV